MGEKRKRNWRGLFYHNTFLLIFSLCVSVVIWFVMASQDTENNRVVYDVPITVRLSEAASADGVQVFFQNYTTADLELTGSNLITNRLTADDFEVTALLNPVSTKLTGNTVQKATIQVRAAKRNSVSDYTIVSVNPEEITVEYDRYKEAVFTVEQDLKYSADTGYYSSTPVLSVESVTVSGPESSVNKISRAAVSYSVSAPLRAEASFTCPVRLYDQDNKEITDTVSLSLALDVDTVDVTIPVLSRKQVKIVASTVRQPKGFPDSRITVEPAQIDIAGDAETLSAINEITLDTPIDFAELDTSAKNVFTMDIPLPAGVRDISTGDSSVSQATVSINLNDFRKVTVSVPVENFQISNLPSDRDVSFTTQMLDVTVIGSEAQVSKLTGDALAVQVDLANFADRVGSVEVPVTIAFTGSGSDSCWAFGKYTVAVELTQDTGERSVALANGSAAEGSSAAGDDDLAATPTE